MYSYVKIKNNLKSKSCNCVTTQVKMPLSVDKLIKIEDHEKIAG